MDNGNVYWLGQDGNIWFKDSSGTRNVGKPSSQGATQIPFKSGMTAGGFDADFLSAEARMIADPLAGIKNDTPVNDGSGGGSGTQYQDTSGARADTLASIAQLGNIYANKNQQARGDYDNVMEAYLQDEGDNADMYQSKVDTNQGNRQAQRQAGLLAAAQGGRGLMSTLASIGALGGTGKTLANRAIANEANLDLGNAEKTFDTNATALGESYGQLKKEERQRRLDAKQILEDTLAQNEYDRFSTERGLRRDMADLWGKAGNFGEADKSWGRSADLAARVAKANRPNPKEYANTPLKYTAPALQNYLAGGNDMTVSASKAQGPINGAVYTSTKKREEKF